MTLNPSEWHRVRELLWLSSDAQMTQLMSLFETEAFKSRNDDLEVNYDREVDGIVYEMKQVYSRCELGKRQAMTEAYYNRLEGYYARAMRIKVGNEYYNQWACYVSRVKKGE
tara:strand:+ start:260 stop:595 length:336 start_codon:yes stop_codon:yes gene_type:complete